MTLKFLLSSWVDDYVFPEVEKFDVKGQRESRVSLGQMKFEMLLRPPNGDDFGK